MQILVTGRAFHRRSVSLLRPGACQCRSAVVDCGRGWNILVARGAGSSVQRPRRPGGCASAKSSVVPHCAGAVVRSGAARTLLAAASGLREAIQKYSHAPGPRTGCILLSRRRSISTGVLIVEEYGTRFPTITGRPNARPDSWTPAPLRPGSVGAASALVVGMAFLHE